jgi:hypothetical protein
VNIDETQLHNWRTELAAQRFEGAYLTRTQTFSVTALVALVSAAGEQVPNMLPFEIEEIPGTREAQEREQALASDEEKQASRANGETKDGVLPGEDKTEEDKHEERQATAKGPQAAESERKSDEEQARDAEQEEEKKSTSTATKTKSGSSEKDKPQSSAQRAQSATSSKSKK